MSASLWRQFMCRHSWRVAEKIYGDGINRLGCRAILIYRQLINRDWGLAGDCAKVDAALLKALGE